MAVRTNRVRKYQCQVRRNDVCEPCGGASTICRFCGSKLPEKYVYTGPESTARAYGRGV